MADLKFTCIYVSSQQLLPMMIEIITDPLTDYDADLRTILQLIDERSLKNLFQFAVWWVRLDLDKV